MRNYYKSGAVKTFRRGNTLAAEGCSETGPLRLLSSHLFRSQYFWKYISYDTNLFKKILGIGCRFQKANEK